MFTGTEAHQLYLLIILIGATILLFTEWIRIDLTAILIILALSITGVLEPQDASVRLIIVQEKRVLDLEG
jgi:hypothetical protein